MSELAKLKTRLNDWQDLIKQSTELKELVQLFEEDADSKNGIQILSEDLLKLSRKFQDMCMAMELKGEYDNYSAILSVKSGAGGIDSQDWAQMLVRMYARWAENKKFHIEFMDQTVGEEAGIKSATLRINGANAYGFLKTERGVHRLIRLSPFDSAHRRHTSFALVEVLPDIEEDEEVSVNLDDVRFDFFRASGHGGQNVQKNSTAVRITHYPTGIVVSVQNERSQAQNRAIALKILQARLVDLNIQRKEQEQQKLKGKHVSAEFGRQVRSYFIHPYQMIKDHTTGMQTTDTQKVLDGGIDEFLKRASRMQSTIN